MPSEDRHPAVPRLTGLLVAVILLATACSSDGAATPHPEKTGAVPGATRTPVPVRTPVRPTPTPVPVRTTPEIDLREPAQPRFITDGIAGWEDAEIGSLCVNVKVEGDLDVDPDHGAPGAVVRWVATSLGVRVVNDGCDARLAVDLAAETASANYSGGMGRCWNGLTGTTTATLSMQGRRSVTGTDDVDREPPRTILKGGCNETASVRAFDWEEMLQAALGEVFGWPFWLALEADGRYSYADIGDGYRESMGDALVNDVVVGLINARLSDADRDARFEAGYFAGTLGDEGSDQTRRLMEPVVPYLVRALALEDDRDLEGGGQMDDGTCPDAWPGRGYDSLADQPLRCTLGRALHYITGATLDARADLWWDWWQRRASGAFSPAGTLGDARQSHTATLLLDGRVLVVGGEGDAGVLATAELWDPESGTFSPAGSLVEARSDHTATLLPDGRVLVVGGTRRYSLASTELWDPESGTFSQGESLDRGRYSHTATLLPDGRVMIVGGDRHAGPLEQAELWDPAVGGFVEAGRLVESRYSHTASRLPDGRVLVVGGRGELHRLEQAELWDPAHSAFDPSGLLGGARMSHSATSLPDGRILVVGGEGVDAVHLATAELWDPASETFGPTGSLGESRRRHTATLLPDGRVLIVGGDGRGGGPLDSAELWVAVTGSTGA